MTELETLQRAKMYLDKLANGIDPLTDRAVSEEDVINQVRISRCFFYVSDVLRRVIDNNGVIGKPAARAPKIKKVPFSITQEQLREFPISQNPIPVSEITRRINDLVDTETMKKLSYRSINSFLLQSGFLEEMEYANGAKAKRPTDAGREIGIWVEERTGRDGNYYVTIYNAEAQQFILDNMDAIAAIESK